jgi:OOP family OmpA-OmpF porin
MSVVGQPANHPGSLVRLLLIAITGATPVPARAQADCSALAASFSTALQHAELHAIASAAMRVADSGCPAAMRADIGRRAAIEHLREAKKLAGLATQGPDKLKLLEAGASFGQPWQLMATIADLRAELNDLAGSSRAYQGSLADIEGLVDKPPAAVVQRLTRLARQARALSPTFVRGEILMRAIAVEAVPVPVQFVYKQDEMTPLGRQYADEMFALLSAQGRPRILLTGHTDPIGSDAYNLELSMSRAQAVKRYLVERGYDDGAIGVEGRGFREPLPVENESQYALPEIHQLQRRVEVKAR